MTTTVKKQVDRVMGLMEQHTWLTNHLQTKGEIEQTFLYEPLGLTISPIAYDREALWKPELINRTFVCPCCGTTYIADKAGFIPKCENCGATMQEEP